LTRQGPEPAPAAPCHDDRCEHVTS
jgi:hypothetical protein